MAVGGKGRTTRPDDPEGSGAGEYLTGAGQGALAGAATGAALGSVVPGFGTAAGAVGGALIGGLGGLGAAYLNRRQPLPAGVGQYDPNAQNFYAESGDLYKTAHAGMGMGSAWQRRQGPMAGAAQAYGTEQQQLRSQQLDYLSQLRGMAQGTAGPSAAEQVVQSQRERNVAQAAALAASGQGVSPALAMKQAQEQQAQAGQAAGQQAAQIRSQEQQQAIAQLGGAMAGMRGQDIGWAQSQAQLRQQTSLANLDAQMQQRQLNDQMTQQFMNMGLSIEEARMQAGIELEKLRAEQQSQMNAMLMEQEQGRLNRRNQLLGGILSGAGSVAAAASDENAKTDIEKTPAELDNFMSELGAYSYKYKDEMKDVPRGKRYGIMAQELERSEVGSTFVIETPQGKAIDVVQSIGPILASLSRLNERQKKLESILKKRRK
jgi:hypothetical protein